MQISEVPDIWAQWAPAIQKRGKRLAREAK